MDASLFRSINRFAAHTTWLHWLFIAVAKYGIVLFALALLGAWWSARASNRPEGVADAIWAGGAALIALELAQIIGGAVDRARPYTTMPSTHVLISRTTDFSFPSDHATIAGAVAAGLVLAGIQHGSERLGLLVSALAVLMAFSRVYVGVHYPGDVLAGLVLGSAVAVGGAPLARRLLNPTIRRLVGTPFGRLLARDPEAAMRAPVAAVIPLTHRR